MNTITICPHCGTKNRIPADKQHLMAKCGKCGVSLVAQGDIVELTDQTFQQVVTGSSLPVMVDFYSPTCGPCQALAPVIVSLASAYAGRVLICKMDTSKQQMTAANFQIRGVPTLIFFKNGQPVDQVVGAVPEQDLIQRLNNVL